MRRNQRHKWIVMPVRECCSLLGRPITTESARLPVSSCDPFPRAFLPCAFSASASSASRFDSAYQSIRVDTDSETYVIIEHRSNLMDYESMSVVGASEWRGGMWRSLLDDPRLPDMTINLPVRSQKRFSTKRPLFPAIFGVGRENIALK